MPLFQKEQNLVQKLSRENGSLDTKVQGNTNVAYSQQVLHNVWRTMRFALRQLT